MVAFVLCAFVNTAGAVERSRSEAESAPTGVQVIFERSGSAGGITGRNRGAGATPTDRRGVPCVYRAEPFLVPDLGPEQPQGPTGLANLYTIYCNADFVETREILPEEFAEVAARMIAERIVRELPIGGVAIGLRPEARGITGIPSLFWVDGYDGEPIERSVSELGMTVEVEVALDEVTWDFGDGTSARGTALGEPWPAESSVRHVYPRSSDDGAAYDVGVAVELTPRWRYDGGAWSALPAIVREAGLAYEVREIEAVRTR
jgi:hypothetical protein